MCWYISKWGFPGGSVGNAGGMGLIPGSGRCSARGHKNLLQYSCLENPMDRGVWWARVHEVARVGHDRATKRPLSPFSQFNSVQSLSRIWLFATSWTAAHQASLFITISQSLLKLMSIESVMSSNHLVLCHPLFLLASIFPSIRVFSNESVCIRWPKYCSFSFSINPSNEYSVLISFRIDWLDLLAVQGTQESSPTPQFKSVSYSVLSFLYGPTHHITYVWGR